ncbi:Ca-activated chloride channel family protein [Brevinema andersonii]|uniref:Ca-activated chloride channel family protein n=1 Tax=Brevinema andersonii TaxID=34097 RepID=A0A1I1E0A9_BREAD|nr:VWA domain-containing protein [Brevinema andersonii]SFB80072.1 Ca-activated chloride channel family protein [Brevinema andersonii]
MNFENPRYLFFLIFIPSYIILKYTKYYKNHGKRPGFPFPWMPLLKLQKDTLAVFSTTMNDIFLLGLVATLSIALARPRGGSAISSETNLGVDIILTTDVSSSMTYVDEPPADAKRILYFGQERFIDRNGDIRNNARIEVAKRVLKNYINKQEYNRLGLVLFSSYALTKAPLSSDKELLKKITEEIDFFDEGATAIGTGLLTALNRLRYSTAKSKVIILLTDGANNAGIVDPITAANAARELGVKIYTIGIGNPHGYLRPLDYERTSYELVNSVEFDPETLQEIADITGGKYFEAQNEDSLQQVYDAIDKLEKSEISVKRRVLYEEKFKTWLNISGILLALWIILNSLIIRIP